LTLLYCTDYDPGDHTLPMLKTCNKPRRVGLSRRAHVCPLHPYFRGKSKAQFSWNSCKGSCFYEL